MSALVFLLLALVIVAVVGGYLWYHDRRPTSIEDGVVGFRRELAALAPDRRLGASPDGVDAPPAGQEAGRGSGGSSPG